MFPILAISKNQEKIDEFVKDFIEKYGFSSAFVFSISPLKTELTIDQIRDLKKDLITQPKEKRLVLLYSFDQANIEAQNAFLKTLEEQNIHNQFVMFVKNVEKILPTIRSRSQILHLQTEESLEIRESTRKLLQTIIDGVSFSFLADSTVQGISREDALIFFQEAIVFLRPKLSDNPQFMTVMKDALKQYQLLESNNLNPQLTIDSFLIHFKRIIT